MTKLSLVKQHERSLFEELIINYVVIYLVLFILLLPLGQNDLQGIKYFRLWHKATKQTKTIICFFYYSTFTNKYEVSVQIRDITDQITPNYSSLLLFVSVSFRIGELNGDKDQKFKPKTLW